MIASFFLHSLSDSFEWGRNDCALWCASAVLHQTGLDPAADLRGTYDSWFGCRRVIMEAGGLRSLISPRMSRFEPIEDEGVALIQLGNRKMCAIIHHGRAHLRLQDGLQLVDKPQILEGWSWSLR